MDDKTQCEVRICADARTEDVIALYKAAGWWDDHDSPELAKNIVRGSFCFACAFIDGRLVGMGRAISDGVNDAYIQDVVVAKEHRDNHVGSRIISTIVERLREKGIRWIALVGEPGTEGFYEKLGFKRMVDYIPMKHGG